MTALDVVAPVLARRCAFDEIACDIEVAVHEVTDEGLTFRALAFFAVPGTGQGKSVVNDRGLPLVAVGKSPSKAASCLASALRRRYGRGAMPAVAHTDCRS